VTSTLRCPVCGDDRLVDTVRRERLPTMQNRVHRTLASALSARAGMLILAVCRTCGFSWNRCFAEDELQYDEDYDNAVPSAVMHAYYAEIASYLVERYVPGDGLVVDVGCGDGTFLRTLGSLSPATHGLGVDPALEADSAGNGSLTLVKDVFSPNLIPQAPALLVSRHVLEHIPRAGEFLRLISESVGRFGAFPCFFEVPDLEWIVRHRTFWDFCYEHCNYFTAASFSRLLKSSGFDSVQARTAFGDQYLWLEATATGGAADRPNEETGEEIAERLLRYAAEEAEQISSMRDFLEESRRNGTATAVWGMATKGVLFTILTDPDASLVDVCVDINPNKQGCFVPLTGHPIQAPDALRSLDRPLLVFAMNENYRAEIEQACAALGVDATVTGASAALS
jgi:hypothetical protein